MPRKTDNKPTLEDKFYAAFCSWGFEPVRQFKPLADRRFLLDFAWPDIRLAVEVQGGVFIRGRSGHSSITGLERDYEKQNLCLLEGWSFIYLTAKDLKDLDHVFELVAQAALRKGDAVIADKITEACNAHNSVRHGNHWNGLLPRLPTLLCFPVYDGKACR